MHLRQNRDLILVGQPFFIVNKETYIISVDVVISVCAIINYIYSFLDFL